MLFFVHRASATFDNAIRKQTFETSSGIQVETMNANVIRAIFKRNFVSYFSNPTGYVFICVFVLLSSFGAFWPNEFFNANLANLDQVVGKRFTFMGFPLRIRAGTGSPVRAVALLSD